MVHVRPTTTPGRPWHVWLIGIMATLWNAMGAVSFVLTQLRVEAVMSRFPPQQRAYFESFPGWAVAFWALTVFGGIAGGFLLLARRRLAFQALVASLIGAIVANVGGLMLLGGMQVMRETGGLGFSALPIGVAAFLAYYAHAMRDAGVLG